MNKLPSGAFRHFKIRQMLLLFHLDQEKSVLAAANAAGMSQPAASKLLRDLEQSLGVPLFNRHARGVEPTPYGRIMLRRAHSVVAEMRRTQEEIESLKRGKRYRVALGSVLSPTTDLLPKALSLIERQHPQMVVSVEFDSSQAMVAKLLEGRLDIVIGRVRNPDNVGELEFEALADEPHVLIARAGHPLARRRKLRIEDLVEQSWILPPADSVLRERIDAMFLQRGLAFPSRIIETLSVPLITNLLRSSDMLVALPRDVVRPYCDAGMLRVLAFDLNVRMDVFGLVTRRGHTLSPEADEARQALRQVARRIYGARPAA